MTEMSDLRGDSPSKLSRRRVVAGTAWSVPVVMGVGAAPAMADSTPPTFTAATLAGLTVVYDSSTKSGTFSGTLSEAGTVSWGAVSQTKPSITIPAGNVSTSATAPYTWTGTFTNAQNNKSYQITATPTDLANNSGVGVQLSFST